jgi:hypothetical protein
MCSLHIGLVVSNILQLVMDCNYCVYIAGYWKMVSATVKENGVQSEEVSDLPPGDYSLVGWDLDTTGRRLLDEICQIAAFCPSVNFSQYVMPFRDLNPAARRRHNIRVVTVGRYRMLKDSKTGKVSCADYVIKPCDTDQVI